MIKPFGLVYCITNTMNGKKYVGKTTMSLAKRWSHHKRSARDGSTCPIHCAIRKYGDASFKMEQVASCLSQEELNEQEKSFITKLSTLAPDGYNLTDGGDGIAGWCISPEARKTLSARMMGKKLFLGRHQTEEAKRKISLANTNPSREKREKIAVASRGRVWTEESRKRASMAALFRSPKPKVNDSNDQEVKYCGCGCKQELNISFRPGNKYCSTFLPGHNGRKEAVR